MIWVEFESQHFRDEAIKKCSKSSFQFKDKKIWAEKDLDYEQRQLLSLLLDIRKNFGERNQLKEQLWVDKDAFILNYYDD